MTSKVKISKAKTQTAKISGVGMDIHDFGVWKFGVCDLAPLVLAF
jgi:hypothetical protein